MSTGSHLGRFVSMLGALALPLYGATDGEVAARNVAESLAGAFSNDGFKRRDGSWMGELEPNKSQLIQVSLYAGNQYWFSLGTTAPAKELKISVHDEAGKPVPIEPYSDESMIAAGFAPQVSGAYYIRIESQSGAAANFCLLYSYK
jgi:hypothetical protein